MTSTYADPDAQMGGAPGPYVNQNGTPPAQQQQQHLTDPELRLQENLQQLRDGGEMMHPGNPQQAQYAQLAQMPPNMGAHQHFQQNVRPTHSPQQMAHAVMSLEGHHDAYDPNDPSRKRSKVSRACDECRRKKVCDDHQHDAYAFDIDNGRFDAMRPVRTGQKLAPAVRELVHVASLAGSL